MKKIHLYVPQWQDSGRANDLYVGAEAIKKHLEKRVRFTEVDVPRTETLTMEHGILGYAPILRQMKECTELLAKHSPDIIYTLGGGCGVEVAPISYLNKKFNGDLTVVWIDAHADLNIPTPSVSDLFHGMSLRSLLGDGDEQIADLAAPHLKHAQVVLCGFRDFDDPDAKYISDTNITTFGAPELGEIASVVDAMKKKGYRNIYIHLDFDVLDPQSFPFVKCPTAHGVKIRALTNLIQAIKDQFNVVGQSILECSLMDEAGLQSITSVLDLWG